MPDCGAGLDIGHRPCRGLVLAEAGADVIVHGRSSREAAEEVAD